MKKNIRVYEKGEYIDKEINYIPTRYIVAVLVTILEVVAIIGIVVLLALYVPYFYIALLLTQIGVVIGIVISNNNPDYKLVWLIIVISLPLIGLMLYLIFYKRKLPKKTIKRLENVSKSYNYDDLASMNKLQKENALIWTQAKSLTRTSGSHLYINSKLKYYSLGEKMHFAMLEELKKAEKFIFMEYYIIEKGEFWGSIFEILKEKAKAGVEVKLIYDDVGCMGTLPGRYYKELTKKYNIQTVLFSKLKGQANSEFNNRSHRKILVIDGKVAFTGGINIADEYINKVSRFGHWKDIGIKVEGESVNELTKLFLSDFCLNSKKEQEIKFEDYYVAKNLENVDNYIIPFGDSPKPLNDNEVSKTAILNLLNQARKYVYIMSPYIVIDTEIINAIKNTAIRGVDIKIIIPGKPDKKLIYAMTKSVCKELQKAGVQVYTYDLGFVHAKAYIADDEYALIGTMNLDYRSLAHNFENGVWIYKDNCIVEMKNDFVETLDNSKVLSDKKRRSGFITKFLYFIVKIFSPLM